MSIRSPSVSPSGAWSASRASARSSALRSIDPPRPAKDGFEWVWFPEGYWAERELERRGSSRARGHSPGQSSPVGKILRWGSSRSAKALPQPAESEQDQGLQISPKTNPMLLQYSPKNLPQSPYLSESEQVAALQHPTPLPMATPILRSSGDTWTTVGPKSATLPDLVSISTKQTTGPSISSVPWRALHRQKIGEAAETPRDGPRTEPVIESAPSYFTQKPIQPPRPSGPGPKAEKDEDSGTQGVIPTPGPAAPAVKGLRKWLFKIPRRRKGPASPGAESAVRDKSAGTRKRWPDEPSTPSSNGSLTAFNRPVYIQASTKSYPAGKATHIETPPLRNQTASGEPRSLFMEIKAPRPLDDESSNSSDSTGATPKVLSDGNSQVSKKKEWWDAPKGVVRRDPVRDVSFFEFHVPEHLPNSPMCPANPKHEGKGKMVCVFHGRGRQPSVDEGVIFEDREADWESA